MFCITIISQNLLPHFHVWDMKRNFHSILVWIMYYKPSLPFILPHPTTFPTADDKDTVK